MRPSESFIGQPIRSLQTMLRVLARDDARYPLVVPDGIYGNDTMRAVIAFQQQNGIPVTGIADQQTWDSIVEAYEDALIRIDKAQYIEVLIEPNQVFRLGDRSPYIYLLQSMLTQLSDDYDVIARPSHSGQMDSPTVTSLESFQKLTNLPITGDADRLTWNHLSRQFTLSAHRNAQV